MKNLANLGTIPPVDLTCFTPHNLHKSYFYLNRNQNCGAASFGLTGYLFKDCLYDPECTVRCSLHTVHSAQCSRVREPQLSSASIDP